VSDGERAGDGGDSGFGFEGEKCAGGEMATATAMAMLAVTPASET